MKKRLLMIVICSCLLVVSNYQGEVKGATSFISGHIQQGQSSYQNTGEEGNDYFFQEGWLKFKQKLSTTDYYYLKIQLQANDYLYTEQYDSQTLDLNIHYTKKLFESLRMKTDFMLRQKTYLTVVEKSYQKIGGSLGFSYRYQAHSLDSTVQLQRDFYPNSAKDSLYSNFVLSYQRKIGDQWILKSRYSITGRFYLYEIDLSDRIRHAISLGFEYQI